MRWTECYPLHYSRLKNAFESLIFHSTYTQYALEKMLFASLMDIEYNLWSIFQILICFIMKLLVIPSSLSKIIIKMVILHFHSSIWFTNWNNWTWLKWTLVILLTVDEWRCLKYRKFLNLENISQKVVK